MLLARMLPTHIYTCPARKPSLDLYLIEFVEGLIDENERNEEGEDLLGERRDVADQEAALSGHQSKNKDHQPEANPHPAGEVLQVMGLAELVARREEWLATAVFYEYQGPMR